LKSVTAVFLGFLNNGAMPPDFSSNLLLKSGKNICIQKTKIKPMVDNG